MTRAPGLAPSRLPRQQRRRIDRQLRKLLCRDACSCCGSPLKHNSRTVGGLNAQGNITFAGECCADQVTNIFMSGFFIHRDYDFLSSHNPKPDSELTSEQIADAIAAYQEAIAATDKQFDLDGIIRRGGAAGARNVSVLDSPWKDDDREWFEQNRERSHRARMPFPDEADEEAAKAPAGHTLILLVRQVEPGTRLKAGFFINAVLLPVPDDEAVAHALFEIATGREAAPNCEALRALVEKYTVAPELDQ
jgi:hypothetical protein